jgi:FKBP-type peptidyl-prolyl cis-trans isomerase
VKAQRRHGLALLLLAAALLGQPGLARAADEVGTALAPPEQLNYAVGRQVGVDLSRLGLLPDLRALVEGAEAALQGRVPAPGEAALRKALAQLKARAEQAVGAPAPSLPVLSYALGYTIGEDFVDQGIRLDAEALQGGARDGARGAPARWDAAEMAAWLQAMKQRIVAAADTPPAAVRADPVQAFFDDNARQPDVLALDSGLQLRVLRSGSGRRPLPGDRVVLAYSGSLLDGTVFTASQPDTRAQDATGYPVATLFPGLREAVLRMNEGTVLEAFVPARLGPPPVRGNPLAGQALIYQLELLSIEAPGSEAAPAR